MAKSKQPMKWKRVKNLAQAYELIDQGIIIKWAEIKTVSHRIPKEQHEKLVQYLVKSICESTQQRLLCEVTVENLVLWLASTHNEISIKAGVEQFQKESNAAEGILKMVEIALSGEISDQNHQEAAYASAVMFICALVKSIEQKRRDSVRSFPEAQKIVPRITTYLLSISNLNDYVIRLSLLHYFGYMAAEGKNQADFEKLINRFGYTVLDYLFSMLFKKKSEGIALQFLLENFGFFLQASSSSQKIIHEILKYYLLKKPDRALLFLQTLGDQLNEHSSEKVRQTYLQHLGALLHVIGKVNHKNLIRSLIICIYKKPHPYLIELSKQIQNEETLEIEDKEFALTFDQKYSEGHAPANLTRSHKRGRHPTFHKIQTMEVFEQVAILGNVGNLGRVT